MSTNTKRCWPPEWIEAALRSGLAVKDGDAIHFSSDSLREMLEEFADGVHHAALDEERNRCRYPQCVENEDERCPRWLTGDCGGPPVDSKENP